MSLVGDAKFEDRVSAALSLADNRASKIDKLIEGGYHDTAKSFAVRLMGDVCEFIADGELNGKYSSIGAAQRLTNTAHAAYRRACNAKAKEDTT